MVTDYKAHKNEGDLYKKYITNTNTIIPQQALIILLLSCYINP